jgi:trk system potassium uptake protein TrkH
VVAVAAVIGLGLCGSGNPTAGHLVLASASLILIPSARGRQAAGDILQPILHHPAGPLVASFFVLSAVGALLLHAPAASRVEGGIASVDAVFTAVSAVCVTGLIVLDTPNDFTGVGQAIILALIQLGALGIMAYSAAVIIGLGRRLRIRDESLIASSLNPGDRGQLHRLVGRLLAFTFACEAAGAIALGWQFHAQGDEPIQAAWRGVFTAISAFCNAGFDLQSDSLIPYQSNAVILHVVGALIILGGLSPVAALAIPRVLRRQEHSAQVKLILVASAALLFANFVLIVAFEWNSALGGMSVLDRLHNAWFQSVTLRTAGFNSIAMDALRPVTLLVMMTSMFIGGSPGGTAGGIKTTTAAVMLLSVVAAIRGNKEIVMFGRRVSTETVDRAAAISTLGLLSLFSTVVVLLLTQAMPSLHAVFEAVSALATVGLSIGGTGELDSVGKVVITIAMFAGRVGPLSMFAFLATRERRRPLQPPVELIDVG